MKLVEESFFFNSVFAGIILNLKQQEVSFMEKGR
jgi:hypothetical protein